MAKATCSACGKGVSRNTKTSRPEITCRECRRKNPRRPSVPAPRICDLCEETYVPKPMHRPDQRFCSKSCAQAWRNGARPPYVKGAAAHATRNMLHSRARKLRRAQTWDGITDAEIMERDGWRCQIPDCKRRPIRKDLKYPHLRSKSIDHIIPLSLGGDDTAVNKRAAHLGCNMGRSNKAGEEQLPLFGSVREPPLATVTVGERAVLLQRRKRFCGCGAVPLKSRKLCQACLDQRAAESIRPCEHCGELFIARQERSRYCSRRCNDTAYNHQRRGVPQWHCACGIQIADGRKKCDDCIRQVRREARRRQRRKPAAKASEARRRAARRRTTLASL